jgi:hypothetical protein
MLTAVAEDMAVGAEKLQPEAEVWQLLVTAPTPATLATAEPLAEVVHWRWTKPVGGKT